MYLDVWRGRSWWGEVSLESKKALVFFGTSISRAALDETLGQIQTLSSPLYQAQSHTSASPTP